MHLTPLIPLALASLAAPSLANDHVVDATGAQGSFTTIGQAMSVALPGDRILVLPGSYPSFLFSRAVEVIGLGASPADVVVPHVGFHVSIPIDEYDAVLENLTVCGSGPGDSTSISGNELAGGTFVIHQVETCGGVFLYGPDFYLLVQDSTFVQPPGGGFLGAAFDIRGTLDMVDSQVVASDATSTFDAGLGLRIRAGSEVRLTRSSILAGDGSLSRPNGGTGVVGGTDGFLRLAGGSFVRGGDAAAGGAGGDGVALDGRIELGAATVLGGGGSPPGAPYGIDPPVLLDHDPELSASPVGADVLLALDGSVGSLPALLGYSTAIDPPLTGHPAILVDDDAIYYAQHQLWLRSPGTWSSASGHGRGRAFFQGAFVDPGTGALVTTNPIVLHFGG